MKTSIDPTTITMRGNTCLVRRIALEEKTKSGIILTAAKRLGSPKGAKKGVLVARGDKAPEELEPGLQAWIHGHAHPQASWHFEGQDFDVYHGEDVLAIIGE